MKFSKQFYFLVMISLTQTVSAKTDVETLMIEQCSSCHGDEVYTRPDRRVNNLLELEKQLHRCNHVIAEKMDIHTVTDVMDYLNKKYYKFKN